MEDAKSRYDLTLDQLTPRDLIIIGATLGTVRFCGRVLRGVIVPPLSRKVQAMNEKQKAEIKKNREKSN